MSSRSYLDLISSILSNFGRQIWIMFAGELKLWGIINTKVDLHVI